jgi:DNA-binding NarL/FixJ family response regulator
VVYVTYVSQDEWTHSTRQGRRPAMIEGLTPREQEVLELLVTGKANKQIAHELGMHQDTVKHHVSEILRKLDVPSRTAAAIWYVGHVSQE